jgi:hypothetical protein
MWVHHAEWLEIAPGDVRRADNRRKGEERSRQDTGRELCSSLRIMVEFREL